VTVGEDLITLCWATLTIVYYLWLNGFQYYDMGYDDSL
jgi:hypothetical protein